MIHAVRVAAAVAVTFLFTSAAWAQSTLDRSPLSTPDDATRVGILGGFEFEDSTGFGLRGDLEMMPLIRLGSTGSVKLLGSASWTYFSDEEGGIDSTVNVFRLIPGVRVSFPLEGTALGIYGDGGVGLYHARVSTDDVTIPGFGTIPGADDNETSFLVRIAGGGFYALSPALRVVAEVGVIPHFGDFDINPFTLFGGISYAF